MKSSDLVYWTLLIFTQPASWLVESLCCDVLQSVSLLVTSPQFLGVCPSHPIFLKELTTKKIVYMTDDG